MRQEHGGECITLLVEAGASLSAVDCRGRTPADIAVSHDRRANAILLSRLTAISRDGAPTIMTATSATTAGSPSSSVVPVH